MLKPTANIAVIALASALLTPVVVGAIGTGSEAALAPPSAAAEAPAPAPEPVCARKVKVVYAGYAGASGCAPAH